MDKRVDSELTGTGDLLVNLGDSNTGLHSVTGPLLFACQGSLRATQPASVEFQCPGVFEFASVGSGGDIDNALVDADDGGGLIRSLLDGNSLPRNRGIEFTRG